MSRFALWLNDFFADFDYEILEAYHRFTESTNGIFTPLVKAFSFLGNGGWFLIVVSVLLLLFPKTRKSGFAMLCAITFGALLTNKTIKPLVARPRPFHADETFRLWWEYVGGLHVSEFSFPSGHTNASMAVVTAFAITRKRKTALFAFCFALVMGMTRNYLMVHYPSDVLFGFLVGSVAGVLGALAAKYVFCLLEKHDNKVCRFILNAKLPIGKKKEEQPNG